MARSLLSASRFLSAFSETTLICRRGYAATSTNVRQAISSEKKMVKDNGVESVDGLKDSSSASWVPDPVTGYYRPANRTGEIDPAELRELLLSNRSRN